MATHVHRNVIGLNIGGNFAAIVQHFSIVDPSETNGFLLAKDLVIAQEAPSAGDPYIQAICEIMATDCFVSSNRAAQLTPTLGTLYARSFAPDAFPGALAGETDSAAVAAVLTTIPAGLTSIHGRNFYPGAPPSHLINGRYTDDYKTRLSAMATVLEDGIAGDFGTWIHTLKYDDPAQYVPIVHYQLGLTPGTIRKRLKPV